MFSFFKKSNDEAEKLYALVQQGVRTPALYVNYGVADTIEGRTEMLYLHASLLLQRLKSEDKTVAQGFIELLFSNMDAELREIGVGDTKVLKKIKDMGKSFYGRLAAYEADDLASAFSKNIPVTNAIALAAYAKKAQIMLNNATLTQLKSAENLFGACHEQ
jgi:cytochrome b pre-mRNA-processing protein 3